MELYEELWPFLLSAIASMYLFSGYWKKTNTNTVISDDEINPSFSDSESPSNPNFEDDWKESTPPNSSKKTNTNTVSDDEINASLSDSESSSNPNFEDDWKESTAPNPSSSIPRAPSMEEYDVFLSFRGPDTRYGFTDILYNYLNDAGIRTFRDNWELREGEEFGPELLKAITESKISIPIFSRNYASSKWCLRELAMMVECKRSMGQIILPIFYDVDPIDVRRQMGSYREAFSEHESRFDAETVLGWREALRYVASLSGWDLNNETGGDQGKLVKAVVSKVLLELKKGYMEVTGYLVGIDHHIEQMMRLLNVDSSDVRIVGIHGMGGLGKTTIAKLILNRLSKGFEYCCFLENVREISQKQKGLVSLQNQLVYYLLKREGPNIFNEDDGIRIIQDIVCTKKVLIVLDDVDHISQFEKLVGKRDWFGSGSRIMVTTRNKMVLDLIGVDWAYEPPIMELPDSLQLFSKHAFRKEFPPEDYELLSKDIASATGGLPLALEILGSFLSGKRKETWEAMLKKLEFIPDDKVLTILRISYDALEHGEKQIFLDIACLPIRVDKQIALYMWEDCQFYPETGIDRLILMSLVKIGDDNTLLMHDQLKLLGREIIRRENFNEPEARTRLWSHKEALDVLKRHIGTEKVEVLCLDFKLEDRGVCFRSEVFAGFSYLRFLKVDYAELAGDFDFPGLRWLHWHKCPGSSTPTNFRLENLVILDLSSSSITDDWEAWSQFKMAKKLKVLDLSFCNGLTRTPDLTTFASLERLILIGCKNIYRIDPSIWNLIRLRVLNISQSAITNLPDGIGNLKDLEELDASGCNSLRGEIPIRIERLSSLRNLRLDFTKVCHLPESIFELHSLQTLNLLGCKELQSLPQLPPSLTCLLIACKEMEAFPRLSNLTSLKTLTFCNTGIRTLPAEVGGLSGLKQLKIEFCHNLQCIMGLPSHLLKLSVEDCKSLQRLPDLSNLKILSELNVSDCPELIKIQGLGKLELLTSLNISCCHKLHELDGLELLESLRYLDMTECSFKELPDVSNLKKLQRFVAMDCVDLIDIKGLDRLESLEYLDLRECMSLEKLPDLSKLGMLKELVLCECDNLVEAEGIWVSKSLERLDMSNCEQIEKLPDLSRLEILKELKIIRWENLTETDGLEKLKSLELLNIAGCKSLRNLPDISNLNSLITLIVSGCGELTEILGLENLKSLRLLDITGCKLIEELPYLLNTVIHRHSSETLLLTCS
ncbi:disease resistance protein RPV1-like isoform X2 [Cornus florida]|uniref:disease resistance protein RPV1-like isoform X2 n=1 Tax=Cornus florida TaxID=4283 RepID=UPI0028A24F1D|nr:disease resistance protein RPV1-like isoform X2 [Cornus florida]